nr:Methyl-coenzyme M reductase II subunit gamma like [Ipomoea batatas]
MPKRTNGVAQPARAPSQLLGQIYHPKPLNIPYFLVAKAMWTPNVIIVQAYAARKIGKDNMKALENNDTTRNLQAVKNISSSAGCFPVMFKKVHPSAAPPPPDSARRPAETARDV